MRPDLPPEWRAKLQEERRQALRAGRYGSFESRSERDLADMGMNSYRRPSP